MSNYNLYDNQLLNSKQAATYLGYKVSYLYNLVCKGEIRSYKGGNRKGAALRFDRRDLDAFLGRDYGDSKIRQ